MLERDEALAELRAALECAREGTGRVVLVAGEAGIGKTTLVRSWLGTVTGAPDVRVLEGACDDLVTARTLGPVHDLAVRAGPALRGALAGADVGAVQEAVLDELATPVTVLVVEDVHWADEATLDVLAVASRRVGRLPCVLVLTLRADEVAPGSRLQRLLGGLSSETTSRPALEPLSVRAVTELAGDAALRLHASTRGNPFLVTELVAARGEGLPVSVRDAVLARVAQLPEQTQRLLDLLAVLPGRAERRLLDALRPSWTDDVEEAERRGVVELVGGAIAFRHELARQTVESALPAVRRLTVEREVLAHLGARDPVDRARVLHHAARCHDIEAVLAHGPAAAREAAAAGAHRQALSFYEQLRPHVELLPLDARAALAEEHAWELYHAHRVQDAVSLAEEAVALRAAGDDPDALVRALVGLSRQLYIRGDLADATEAAERAVRRAPGAAPGSAGSTEALARTHHAVLRVLADDESTGLVELDTVIALAVAHDQPALAALGRIYEGLGRAFLGDEQGPEHVRAGIADAEAAGQREYVARGYTSLVKALRRVGRDAEVPAVVAEGLERTQAQDFLSHAYTLEAHRYQLMLADGRWDEAETGFRRLVDDVPEGGILARETLPFLARLLVRRGRADAIAVLERAWALGRRADSLPILLPTAAAAMELAWLEGDSERERDRVEELLGRTGRPGLAGYVGDLLRYARRGGLALAVPTGLWPRHARGLEGDVAGAAAEWERLGDPYEQALDMAESADEDTVLEALGILDGLGAAPAARLVRVRLRALGSRRIPRGPLATTRAHPAGLTPRQADILALLTDGLTNVEIARRLVLSVRTVDHHVSAVLAKLGAPSRAEAARWAAEHA